MCVHEVLVNRLVKLAQGKGVVRQTGHSNMNISVDWDKSNKPTPPSIKINICSIKHAKYAFWKSSGILRYRVVTKYLKSALFHLKLIDFSHLFLK